MRMRLRPGKCRDFPVARPASPTQTQGETAGDADACPEIGRPRADRRSPGRPGIPRLATRTHEGDLMRRTLAAVAAGGALLAGIATASPALAGSQPITLLCSPGTNGGTLVHGVCVLPGAKVGHPYEGFLLTSNGAVDTFTITSGSVPPACSCQPPTAWPGPSSVARPPRQAHSRSAST
jgi:hypothetical protein